MNQINTMYSIIFKRTGYTWFISAILYKRENLCDLLFAFLYTKLLLKGVYSKMKDLKDFALVGSKLFSFTADPF